jgi:hypothetical protein
MISSDIADTTAAQAEKLREALRPLRPSWWQPRARRVGMSLRAQNAHMKNLLRVIKARRKK